MKGIIQQMQHGLGVTFSIVTTDTQLNITLPLHPYESTEGLWVNKQVDFDIERFWEAGIEKPFDVAIVKPFDISTLLKNKKKKKNGKGNS